MLVLAPILIACARGLADGWVPEGDEALVLIRSGDIFGGHPPLLGMPSTAANTSGLPTNHPGPLLFWVLAPITTIGHGSAASLLVATALLLGAAAMTMVFVGWRCSGAGGAVVVGIGVLLLEHSLAASNLRDPLNSAIVILPMGAALALAVGAYHYGRWTPALVLFASISMQAYIAYAIPGAACIGLGVAGLWRLSRTDRRRAVRGAYLAAVTLVALWAPVAVEQLWGDQHNVSRMVQAATADVPTAGTEVAFNKVGWMLGPIPVALRSETLDPWAAKETGRPWPVAKPDGMAWAGTILVAGIAATAMRRSSARSPIAWSLAVTSVTVGALGFFAVARLPFATALRGDPYWWMWPWSLLVAITAIAQVAPWARSVAERGFEQLGIDAHSRRTAAVGLAGLAAFAIAVTPTAPPSEDPAQASRRIIRTLTPALVRELDPAATYSVSLVGVDSLLSVTPGLVAALDAEDVGLAMSESTKGSYGDRITSTDPPTGGDVVIRSNETGPVPGGRLLAVDVVDDLRVDVWLVPPPDATSSDPADSRE